MRYIRDDPSLMKRATSTSVDPNVLGSLLNMTIAFTVTSDLIPGTRYYRVLLSMVAWELWLYVLGLTVSRGAMLGCAFAIGIISFLRYRKLLPWMVIGLVLVFVLPWTQELVIHFLEGFQLQDLSTQMRLGEYKDALF